MNTSIIIPLVLILTTAIVSAEPRAGRVSRTGPRGGTVEAEGARVGRVATGSVDAEGPRGGSVEASGTRVGRVATGTVSAEGPAGRTVDKTVTTTTRFAGYRAGYVYRNGVYETAVIRPGAAYIAPIGVYAGWSVIARPYYVSYPAYATYPVEISVQVELQKRGYYNGPIDGDIGQTTRNSISKYQADNKLAVTGTITEGLLKSLGIMS